MSYKTWAIVPYGLPQSHQSAPSQHYNWNCPRNCNDGEHPSQAHCFWIAPTEPRVSAETPMFSLKSITGCAPMFSNVFQCFLSSLSWVDNQALVVHHHGFCKSISQVAQKCAQVFQCFLSSLSGVTTKGVHHHGMCKSLSLVVHNLRNLLKNLLAPENLEINWCRPQIWRSYENMRELQKYLGDVKIWRRSQVKACTSNFCNCARLWNCRFPLIVFELERQSSNISPWSKLHILDISFL